MAIDTDKALALLDQIENDAKELAEYAESLKDPVKRGMAFENLAEVEKFKSEFKDLLEGIRCGQFLTGCRNLISGKWARYRTPNLP